MKQLPKFFRVRQTFARPVLSDIAGTVKVELARLDWTGQPPGGKIGITAGSRGIRNIVLILQTVAAYVRDLGFEPYILAAMGSHGGGTATGQKEVLDSLGITEQAVGAPVLTSADCMVVGHSASGIPAYAVEPALTLDGIVVINRIKTHTSFKGKVESGLVKKMVVGLGGPAGAQQFHSFGSFELPRLLVEIGETLIDKLPVIGGLGIVENAYEETVVIRGMHRAEILMVESELLTYSKSLMPALPVDELDLLIVEEMGKNFSGTGMDTNIIGRARIQGVPEPERPFIKRIAVLDLSEESHGNATGIGLADFTTEKLVQKMDRHNTYLNCLTSTFVMRSAIPMYFGSERQVLEAAVSSLGSIPGEQLRVVLIPNTLFLTDCYVSEALAPDLERRTGIEVCERAAEVAFDAAGNMLLRIGC